MAKDLSNVVVDFNKGILKEWRTKTKKSEKELSDVNVGTNGFAVGTELLVMGITIAEVNGNYYPAIVTDKGNVSVRAIMGLTSFNGYITDNNVDVVCEFVDSNGNDQNRIMHATYDGTSVDNLYQPSSRNLATYLALLDAEFEGDEIPDNAELRGKTLVFHGTALRQFTARQDAPSTFSEKYKAGQSRVITAQGWEAR